MWKLFKVTLTVLLFSGALSAQTITYPGSNPGFCPGGQLLLTAMNPPAGTFQWQYSPTYTGTYVNVGANINTHSASAAGFYTVSVTGAQPIQYDTVQVTVNPKPVADFTFTGTNACSGSNIPFTSSVTSGTPGFSYAWDFGDGNSSTVANPIHAFTSLGCGTETFNVRLIVTDSRGCRDTVTKSIAVRQRPDVRLSDADIFGPWSNCENNPTALNPNFVITVNNSSPSAACITSYNINWGDGNTQTGVTFPLSHTYTQLGAFNLVVTAFGSNGCNSTQTYVVANQSNPAGGLATLGSTTNLCVPSTIPFIITNWENNSPGTIYQLDFGDGVVQTLSHPLNATNTPHTVNHQYLVSSCPQPTYTALLTVINACDSTPYTAGNIQIRIAPQASFTVQPNPGCAGQNICFTNTTVAGNTGSNCSPITAYLWNFGDPASGANNTSTEQNPCHVFSAPGTYTVTLTSSNPCGPSVATQVVCIAAPIAPAFTVNNIEGCAPLSVTVNNTTDNAGNCVAPSWLWTVTYSPTNCGLTSGWSFANGTTSNSQNPQFTFSNPGTYTIELAATNPCGTFRTSRTVVVKQPPTVTLPTFAPTCGTASISPIATVANCGNTAPSYSWSFPGGTPSSASTASPGTIVYSTPGNYTITLAVTNECGTTTVTRNLTVHPVPAINTPSSVTLCAGENAGPFNFTSVPAGATFSWTNSNTSIGLAASGTGNIPSFSATNPGSSPIIATVTVTASNTLCTSQRSFTITVNPRPVAPVVVSPVAYCQLATPVPLAATAIAGHSLLWYTVSTGGTGAPTAPTPSTATVGTTTWYVSQVNSTTGCEGLRTPIAVTIKPIPSIANVIGTNPTSCGSNNGSILLSGLIPNTLFTVHYLQGGNPVTLSATSGSGGTITISNLPPGTYSDIYVSLSGCNSNILGPVQLTNPQQPATPVIAAVAPLCSGGTLNLSATTATPGVSWNWTGPNSFNSNSQNPNIPNVTVAASGTYVVTVTINNCVSAAASTVVQINPTPATPSASNNGPVCEGIPISLSASTTTTGSISYAWTGPNSYTSALQNPIIASPVTGTYTVVATATTNGQSCPGAPASTSVLVKPVPQISDSSFTNPLQCSQPSGTIVLNGLMAGNSYTVLYNFNSSPQS
ncbi:MAG: PKD domain-containing protein, partial [Sphingobacteriales bacterium]